MNPNRHPEQMPQIMDAYQMQEIQYRYEQGDHEFLFNKENTILFFDTQSQVMHHIYHMLPNGNEDPTHAVTIRDDPETYLTLRAFGFEEFDLAELSEENYEKEINNYIEYRKQCYLDPDNISDIHVIKEEYDMMKLEGEI